MWIYLCFHSACVRVRVNVSKLNLKTVCVKLVKKNTHHFNTDSDFIFVSMNFFVFILPISSFSFFNSTIFLCGSFRFSIVCEIWHGLEWRCMCQVSRPILFYFNFCHIFLFFFVCVKIFVQCSQLQTFPAELFCQIDFHWISFCVCEINENHYCDSFEVLVVVFLSFIMLFWLFARLVWLACLGTCVCVCLTCDIFYISSFAFTLSFLSP